MSINLTTDDLIQFEEEIAQEFSEGKIPFPVHLRGSDDLRYEYGVLSSIRYYYKPGDFLYNYWASHCWALACGIDKEKVREKIRKGFSISMCFPEHNFYCSGIVASLCGVAVGTAMALKRAKSPNKVLHVCGDMAAHTGVFRTAVEYALNWQLPIRFIIEDNGVSVTTQTRKVWNVHDASSLWFHHPRYSHLITSFQYINKFSHSGISRKVAF